VSPDTLSGDRELVDPDGNRILVTASVTQTAASL
jgi:hypothetical protein